MKMNHQRFALTFVMATLIATAGLVRSRAAETPTVESRLSQLEKSLETLQKENTDLKKQLGYDGKTPLVVVKPSGKESKLNIGGYFQGHAEFGDEPDVRFRGIEDRAYIRRARVNVTGAFAENFDFKVESDFGANSMAETTGYRAQITDAYLNWNRYSFANVKFGQFKTPFGYEQLMADTKILTIERSLPNDYMTDGRQIGLGVAGDFFEKRLGYSVGAFNGTGVNSSQNDNNNFMYAGRLTGVAFTGKVAKHDLRVALGVNGLTTRDIGKASPTLYGFDSVPGGAVDNIFTGRRYSWGLDS